MHRGLINQIALTLAHITDANGLNNVSFSQRARYIIKAMFTDQVEKKSVAKCGSVAV